MRLAALRQDQGSVDEHPASPAGSPIRGGRAAVKAVLDRGAALLLIVFLLPIFILVPLLILADDGGPVLFAQSRWGRGGRTFRILKFRTLKTQGADPSGALQVGAGDPRVTRIGRFLRSSSLDEIPQLFNVLFGDMALVGPRPHPIGMRTEGLLGVEICARYMDRYQVRPGMTGLAQVRGRRGPTRTREELKERLALDFAYIDGWSLGLDLKILLLTPACLFTTGRGR